MFTVVCINSMHFMTRTCTDLEHPRALYVLKKTSIYMIMGCTEFKKITVHLLRRQDKLSWGVQL